MILCVCVATPVVRDAISVKRLRYGGAVELRWSPSSSDGTGLILYIVERISVDTVDTAGYKASDHWTLLTRVYRPISVYISLYGCEH